jgi:polyketide synthase 13
MTDTEIDSQPTAEAAAGAADTPARTDMTIAEVRQWLRNWVATAVGQSPDAIDECTPMVELGLSSRDAVAMAADIEDRTGVTVSIAAAFEHPTIETLATWIVEGDPFDDSADSDDTDWTRSGPVERVDIAVVGLATRLPGDMNTADETWQALLEGRDAITDLPEGRWSEFMEEPRLAALI